MVTHCLTSAGEPATIELRPPDEPGGAFTLEVVTPDGPLSIELSLAEVAEFRGDAEEVLAEVRRARTVAEMAADFTQGR